VAFDTVDGTEALDIFPFRILCLLVQLVLHDVELLIVIFFQILLKAFA